MSDRLYQLNTELGLSLRQIRSRMPHLSLSAGSDVPGIPGLVSYRPVAPPDHDHLTHDVREIDPANGVQQWELYPLPAEEAARRQETARMQFMQACIDAAQARLDAFAAARGYDNIISLCSYYGSTVSQFSDDAQRGIATRDNTWAHLHQFMGEVERGDRPPPASVDDVIGTLPTISWED